MAKNKEEALKRHVLVISDDEGNFYCIRQETLESARVNKELAQRFQEFMDGKEVGGIAAREVASEFKILRTLEIRPTDSSWIVEALRGL